MTESLSSSLSSIPIKDCIHEEQKHNLSSYFTYMTCEQCHFIILDPKYCQLCAKTFCSKCQCFHKPKVSRYIEELVEKVKCKCRFSCGAEPFALSKLYEHIEGCKFKSQYIALQVKNSIDIDKESSLVKDPSKEKSGKNKEKFQSKEIVIGDNLEGITVELLINETGNNGNIEVKCFECNQLLKSKQDYIQHIIKCLSRKYVKNDNEMKNNNKEEGIKQSNAVLQKKFEESFNLIRTKMSLIFKEKLLGLKEIFHKEICFINEDIKEKEKELLSKDDYIKKYNTTPTDLFIKDKTITLLKANEESLTQEKTRLINQYNTLHQEIQHKLNSSKNTIANQQNTKLSSYINQALESKWNQEIITTFSIGFNNHCNKCNSDQDDNKYSCVTCRQKFCKEKCIQKCLSKDCTNYICLKCTLECQLCHKQIYCDQCKKKCFYEKCDHIFCLQCYKKNEHQARSSNTNCKFFTCDTEKINVCLMTTLFCSKCEKRMCNKCLLNDKKHHDTLKIFA